MLRPALPGAVVSDVLVGSPKSAAGEVIYTTDIGKHDQRGLVSPGEPVVKDSPAYHAS